ncbi:hypothetical protein E3N88_04092 [Mikania micrantha]|uniref:Retrovirus-related Pol polyprotein from transposon TNT 1-94-like beta-barrel domain-containing protein n=1 Tax=Mikania micrantha TaxID=192012 RepID=A0A5N6PTE8_9ASTR|nr:hypothetical protein E3N88_04092 [Mikania micrantha]
MLPEQIRKSSDDESWVNRLGGSLRKVKPSEEEMRVLRKFDPDFVWDDHSEDGSSSSSSQQNGRVASMGHINSRWIVDSGCSRHMTGDLNLLRDFRLMKGSYVNFAGDKGGQITGFVIKDIMWFEKDRCYVLKQGFQIPEEWCNISAGNATGTVIYTVTCIITQVQTM